MKPSRVTRDWEGLTAVVIASGPSMLAPEWEGRLRAAKAAGAKLLLSNGAYKSFPFADVLMCSDRHWLKDNPDLSGFRGEEIIITRPEAVRQQDARMIHIRRAFIERVRGDIFANPRTLVEGHTSTSTNISLAVMRGVSRIVLVGLDLAPGPRMRRRLYDKTSDTEINAKRRYARQVEHLSMQAKYVKSLGIEVLNCSPPSALKCYPYSKWESLQWPNRSES